MRSTPEARQRVYLSPYEAGEYVGTTSRTIRRWIAEGRLPAKRFGPRTVRIHPDDLDALGREVPTAGDAA